MKTQKRVNCGIKTDRRRTQAERPRTHTGPRRRDTDQMLYALAHDRPQGIIRLIENQKKQGKSWDSK